MSKTLRSFSMLLLATMVAAVLAAAVPSVSIATAYNTGSNVGYVSFTTSGAGCTNSPCTYEWVNSAGGSGFGTVTGVEAFYVYPLASGSNRITVNVTAGDGSGQVGTARASIEN